MRRWDERRERVAEGGRHVGRGAHLGSWEEELPHMTCLKSSSLLDPEAQPIS